MLAWSRAQHAATLAYLDRAAPPISGMKEEIARWYDRDHTERAVLQKRARVLQAREAGEPQAKLYTRVDGREVLLVDPMAIDPSGKTKIGASSRTARRRARRSASTRAAPRSRISASSTRRTGAQIGPILTGVRAFDWARDEAFAFISPRTAGGRRETGAASLLSAQARRGPRDRRAADRDGRREELVRRLRARGRAGHRVRNRRFLVEHDQDPAGRLDRGAADDLHERQIPGRRDLPPRPHLLPHQPRRAELETDGGELCESRVRRLDDADPRGHDGDGRCRRHARAALSCANATMSCRGSRCTGSTEARQRELEPPVFGSVVDLGYDLGADTPYAALASHTAPPSLYALAARAFAWKQVWQDETPFDTSAFVSKRVYVTAKDGAKIPVFIVHRKDVDAERRQPDAPRCLRRLQHRGRALLSGRLVSVREPRRHLRRSGRARRLRVRRDLARAGDVRAQAEHVRRHHRRRRMAGRARSTRSRPSSHSRAAATAGSPSARCSRSAPTCSAPRSARCRCSTWSASTSS